jgi:hypothetical protein
MAKFGCGTKMDSKGYISICAGPLRYKRVHLLVAEAMLGRPLRKDETVNHKDANRANCHWSNLEIIGRDIHGAVSNRQKWFLKNKADHERKQWEEWINTGENRPVEDSDSDPVPF